MAKNKGKASAKRRQAALKRARKDGKVTRKEAKKLTDLGVSKKRVTKENKKVKVTTAAKRTVAKASPPSPTASARAAGARVKANAPTPTPPPSRSSNIFKQKATGGNKFLTGKQANQVLKLVKDPQRFPPITNKTTDRDGNVISSSTPGDIDYGSFGGDRLINKALRGLKAQGININDISSQNDLNKIRGYVKPIATQNNDGLPGGDRGTGDFNDIVNAYKQDAQTLADRGDGYKDLLKNTKPYSPEFVAMAEELGRIPSLQEVKAATKGIGGKNNDKAYDKFLNALGNVKNNQDKGLGKGVKGGRHMDMEAEWALIAAELGLDPAAGPGGVKPPGGGGGDGVTPPGGDGVTPPGGDGGGGGDGVTPPTTPIDEVNPYDGIITGLQTQIADLQLQTTDLGDLANGFAASNAFLSDQAAASAAAYAAAEKRAGNLANAFVPNANPNANSIQYGDYRKKNRRKEDNQLSDLSILSDVGNSTDPLVGLQLA